MFAIVGVIVNTISVFSVKELPEEELNGDGVVDDEIEKYGLVEAAKLLFSNKYCTADIFCHAEHGYLLYDICPS